MGSHVGYVAGSRDADLPTIIDHKRLLQSDWPAVHSAWLHNFGVCFSPDPLPRSKKGAGPRGPSLPKYVYEICKSIGFGHGFVDLIVEFVDVTIEFLVDLDFNVGFGGFSIGFGFGKRCMRFGGVSDPSGGSPDYMATSIGVSVPLQVY